jgi:hypothetical protein
MNISISSNFRNLSARPTLLLLHWFVNSASFMRILLFVGPLVDPFFMGVITVFPVSATLAVTTSAILSVSISFLISELFYKYPFVHAFFHPAIHPLFLPFIIPFFLYCSL